MCIRLDKTHKRLAIHFIRLKEVGIHQILGKHLNA